MSIGIQKGKAKDIAYVEADIPDEVVEEYARQKFGLMTFEEAIQDYEPEAPDYDEND